MKYKILAKWRSVKNYFYSFFGAKVNDQLFANPLMKWPRNHSCLCGSRKKFKVCCNLTLAKSINLKDLNFINKRLTSKGISL